VKCDRWEDCNRRLEEACERLECPYRDTHRDIDTRLTELKGRDDKQDRKLEDLEKSTSGIREELAGIRGEIRGALAASKVSGSIVGALVSSGLAGVAGIVVYLLNRK